MNTLHTINPPRPLPGGNYQVIVTDADGYEVAAFWAETPEEAESAARMNANASALLSALQKTNDRVWSYAQEHKGDGTAASEIAMALWRDCQALIARATDKSAVAS